MEQNLPVVTKKIWNMVRLALYMIRKGMWKNKLLLDLNLMMKQGKLAGKTLFINLMFHHHYASASKASVGGSTKLACGGPKADDDQFFSCTNTPLYITHKSDKNPQNSYDIRVIEAMNNLWETLSSNDVSVTASPVKPRAGFGFGPSAMVRQIRVTDSPYPLQNDRVDELKYVDEAADVFIKRFYSRLKQQS